MQAFRKYRGSLEGKTVFIPAGRKLPRPPRCKKRSSTKQFFFSVSGTGAYACQLAKNVFHAGKVITTVSTAKVAKVPELLGKGVVDESTFVRSLKFPNIPVRPRVLYARPHIADNSAF